MFVGIHDFPMLTLVRADSVLNTIPSAWVRDPSTNGGKGKRVGTDGYVTPLQMGGRGRGQMPSLSSITTPKQES